MLSYIEQEGFPLVTVETEEVGGNLSFTISQRRFVSMGPTFWDNDGTIPFVTEDLGLYHSMYCVVCCGAMFFGGSLALKVVVQLFGALIGFVTLCPSRPK